MNKLYTVITIGGQTSTLEATFEEEPTWMELLPTFQTALAGAGYVLLRGSLVLLEEDEVILTKEELSALEAAVAEAGYLRGKVDRLRERIETLTSAIPEESINND